MDMSMALAANGDREEAIKFLAADRIQRNFRGEVTEDYSTPEREYAAHMFPLERIFDPDEWSMGFQEHWDYDRDKIRLWNSFRTEVIRRFDTYELPVIELGRDTPRQAVCQVFEKVNTGGVTLTVFSFSLPLTRLMSSTCAGTGRSSASPRGQRLSTGSCAKSRTPISSRPLPCSPRRPTVTRRPDTERTMSGFPG